MRGVTPVGLGQTGRSRGGRRAAPAPISPDPGFAAWNPRRPSAFASTEHLNPEAVVAYVDNELTIQAAARADTHLALCHDCAREVTAQARARTMLQACQTELSVPDSLRAQLSRIPTQEIDLRSDRRTNRWGR
ncbi:MULTISPECIES: zf-HC2 domain-containing protein [Gordonia]